MTTASRSKGASEYKRTGCACESLFGRPQPVQLPKRRSLVDSTSASDLLWLALHRDLGAEGIGEKVDAL
jgi:hypothetical protein